VRSISSFWANNITGDKIKAGEKLRIPPMDGLEYKVKTGDSVKSVANYFATDAKAIISFSRLGLNNLKPGRTIYIPDGVKPKPPQSSNDPSSYDTVTISRVRAPVDGNNG